MAEVTGCDTGHLCQSQVLDCFNCHNEIALVSFNYNTRHNYLDNAHSHYKSNWFTPERARL